MTALEHSVLTGRPILLYDGVCGLCNRLVRFFLRIDPSGALLFAPLESPLALELRARFPASSADSEGIILITYALTPQEMLYRRSEAVARALRYPGSIWRLLGALLLLVPRFLREAGYGIIARNRYRVFGKFDTCPMPTEAQRSRILGM